MTEKLKEKVTVERSQRKRRSPSQPPTGPARFNQGAGLTNADIVYSQLHKAIAAMDLRPGTPISEQSLAAEHGVSRTPVREAILRLVSEKLVEIVPKSGSFVGRIPVSSLIEAIVARQALESVNVRRAAELATPSQILELRAMLERQREIAVTGDHAVFHTADEDFHAAFANIAGYAGIWQLIRQMKLQIDRYRHLTLPQAGRIELIINEHANVVDAMAEGDIMGAVRCMENHLDKLQLDLAIFEEMWPNYFIHDQVVGD